MLVLSFFSPGKIKTKDLYLVVLKHRSLKFDCGQADKCYMKTLFLTTFFCAFFMGCNGLFESSGSAHNSLSLIVPPAFAKTECNKNNYQNYIFPKEVKQGKGSGHQMLIWTNGEKSQSNYFILDHGVKKLKRAKITCELKNLDLSNMDHKDSAGALYSYWIKEGADYRRVKAPLGTRPESYDFLVRASFAGADLTNAKFNPNKEDKWFSGTFADDTDFTGSNLTNADLSFVNDGIFIRANLTNAKMTKMSRSNLSEANLEGADISNSHNVYKVKNANFTNVKAHNVTFEIGGDNTPDEVDYGTKMQTVTNIATGEQTKREVKRKGVGINFGNADFNGADFTGSVFKTTQSAIAFYPHEKDYKNTLIDFRKVKNFKKAKWDNVTFKGKGKSKYNPILLTEEQLDHLIANKDKITLDNVVLKTPTREVTNWTDIKTIDKKNSTKTLGNCHYKKTLASVMLNKNCGQYCYALVKCDIKGVDMEFGVHCKASEGSCPTADDCIKQTQEQGGLTKNKITKSGLVSVEINNCGKYCYGKSSSDVSGFKAEYGVHCKAVNGECPQQTACATQTKAEGGITEATAKPAPSVKKQKKGLPSFLKWLCFFCSDDDSSSTSSDSSDTPLERAREAGGDRSGGTK